MSLVSQENYLSKHWKVLVIGASKEWVLKANFRCFLSISYFLSPSVKATSSDPNVGTAVQIMALYVHGIENEPLTKIRLSHAAIKIKIRIAILLPELGNKNLRGMKKLVTRIFFLTTISQFFAPKTEV